MKASNQRMKKQGKLLPKGADSPVAHTYLNTSPFQYASPKYRFQIDAL